MNHREQIHEDEPSRAPADSRVHAKGRAPPARGVDPPASKDDTKAVPPSSEGLPYKNLRRLPGYALGDALRPEDAMLCDSKEATMIVMNNLRLGDCAFVLRSDAAFTYAAFEGLQSEKGESSFVFRLGDDGQFKIVARDKFLGRVKVPVLPRALVRNAMDWASKQGEAGAHAKKALRRSSEKCESASKLSTPSRRRFSCTPGQRTDAVPEAQQASRQDEAGANIQGTKALRRSSEKYESTPKSSTPSRRRFSCTPVQRTDAVPEVQEANIQGKKAPRRSSEKCESISKSSTPSRRRFSCTPDQGMDTVPEVQQASVQGKKALRRSSERCEPASKASTPSRRRFSCMPGQHFPQTEDVQQQKSPPEPTEANAGRRWSCPSTGAPRKSGPFSIGDVIPKECMPPAKCSETAIAVSSLKVGDTAFVRRSCGRSYSYSLVTRRDADSITFRVTTVGNTKTFELSKAGKFVRIIQEGKMEDVGGFGDAATRATEDMTKDGDEDDGELKVSLLPPAYLPASLPPPCRLAPTKEAWSSTSQASEASDPKNASRRTSLLSSSSSATSLCSIASDDTVCSDDANTNWGTLTDVEPPRGPSPSPSSSQQNRRKRGERTRNASYKAGMRILYKGADGPTEAQILARHHDDLLEPYYTIELAGGREKQTDEGHILGMAP